MVAGWMDRQPLKAVEPPWGVCAHKLMSIMTSKDRVYAALRRQPADRVPVFMWFHPATAARLGVELGVPSEPFELKRE